MVGACLAPCDSGSAGLILVAECSADPMARCVSIGDPGRSVGADYLCPQTGCGDGPNDCGDDKGNGSDDLLTPSLTPPGSKSLAHIVAIFYGCAECQES